jgi:hypothetical protein
MNRADNRQKIQQTNKPSPPSQKRRPIMAVSAAKRQAKCRRKKKEAEAAAKAKQLAYSAKYRAKKRAAVKIVPIVPSPARRASMQRPPTTPTMAPFRVPTDFGRIKSSDSAPLFASLASPSPGIPLAWCWNPVFGCQWCQLRIVSDGHVVSHPPHSR